MRTQHVVRANKWVQWERVGMIPYVWMRFRFVVRIRMRQTESVYVVIQNVSAHESDREFSGVALLQVCFPNYQKWGKVLAFYICHRGLKHVVAESTLRGVRAPQDRLRVFRARRKVLRGRRKRVLRIKHV